MKPLNEEAATPCGEVSGNKKPTILNNYSIFGGMSTAKRVLYE